MKALPLLAMECCLKIIFGDFVTGARASQGGSTYSSNKGGPYKRNKVTPSNPATVAQTSVRTNFGQYAQNWRSLSASQRTAWNSAASGITYTNSLNQQYKPTGLQYYVGVNRALVTAGQTAITDPPTLGTVTAPATLTVTMAAGTPAASLAFTASPVAAGMSWVVYATKGLSPGVTYAKNQFRKVGVIAAAATTPSNQLTNYTAKYGAVPATGQKVFWRIIAVNNVTGQQSVALDASCIVAA